ncbi:hypothetical protein SAMN04487945_0884 [Halobacterium jilantaiense]|uniref:DUF8168 domain-containing protein n=2 Tax=Halobacterium jilantaiense TaxID=355548 RepID=A0A1I0NHH6_9EURY|nr:hypothetical protein SAMN04487945_0884 [Halobacterium jilantaiense]
MSWWIPRQSCGPPKSRRWRVRLLGVVVMSDAAESAVVETESAPLVGVYRHDVHKARLRSHADAEDWVAGVRVNQAVPRGADGDAALLSRPRGEPSQTFEGHDSPYRLSLVSGSISPLVETASVWPAIRDLIQLDDPVELHAAWLASREVGVFSESVYYPYTSLKYHTLLAAALFDNYRAGYDFEDLYLAVEPAGKGSPDVVPHRTVLETAGVALTVTGEPDGRPAARLGGGPVRSFADVWSRLPEHPFQADSGREWRVLDAQLRRIRSWSTALQYIEDYCRRFESGGGSAAGFGGGR